MKNQRFIIGIILLVLLICPLFWFPKDALDVGGDDSKLYFLAPENYISNFSLYVWNSYNALSNEYTPWYGFPFIFIPFLLKKIGLSVGHRQMILYGFVLMFGFLAAYIFIRELLKPWKINIRQKSLAAIVGALIYVFSPIVLIVDWQFRSPYMIFVYPLLLYFFVLAVNRRKIIYLVIGALLSAIFSFTIHMSIPWFAGFFMGAVIFLAGLFFISKEKVLFVKYLVLYFCFFFIVNLQWILIMLDMTVLTQTVTSSIGETYIGSSIAEFMHNVRFMNVVYALLMLPSKEFALATGSIFTKIIPYKYSFMFIPLPILIALGLIKGSVGQRRTLLLVLLPFMMFAFCITVNITDLGIKLFAFLIQNVFGFVMFKNFQTKFSVALSFFYAVTIGVSLAIILLQRWRPLIKNTILVLLIVPFFLPAKALLGGRLVGASPGVLFHEYLCAEIPESHFKALDVIKADKEINRVFIFPQARFLFMVTKCDNQSYYVGMPYIKPLTMKESFEGIWSFRNPNYPELHNIVYKLLDDNNYPDFYKILWLLNVKYVYLYNEVAPESAQLFLFKYNFMGKMKSELLKTLTDSKIGDFGDIQLYTVPYSARPFHIMAKSYITAVDDYEWLSKVVYTDYIEPKEKPLVIFN